MMKFVTRIITIIVTLYVGFRTMKQIDDWYWYGKKIEEKEE